ncbi:unnamed protein product, partial [Ectocarpus sp. 12 AP-2014]
GVRSRSNRGPRARLGHAAAGVALPRNEKRQSSAGQGVPETRWRNPRGSLHCILTASTPRLTSLVSLVLACRRGELRRRGAGSPFQRPSSRRANRSRQQPGGRAERHHPNGMSQNSQGCSREGLDDRRGPHGIFQPLSSLWLEQARPRRSPEGR